MTAKKSNIDKYAEGSWEKQLLGFAGYIECLSMCALSFNGGKPMGKTLGKCHIKADAGLFSPDFPRLPSHCSCLFIDFLLGGFGAAGGVCRIICFYFNLT